MGAATTANWNMTTCWGASANRWRNLRGQAQFTVPQIMERTIMPGGLQARFVVTGGGLSCQANGSVDAVFRTGCRVWLSRRESTPLESNSQFFPPWRPVSEGKRLARGDTCPALPGRQRENKGRAGRRCRARNRPGTTAVSPLAIPATNRASFAWPARSGYWMRILVSGRK